MKQITLLSVLMFFVMQLGFAQTNPTIGTIENDTIIVNTGENIILLPEINDGDAGVDQDITFTVTSDAPDTVAVGTVNFDPTQTYAVLHVTDQGLLGSATIEVTIDDGDGTDVESFDIVVGTYNKPGVNYEIHDIVFWKNEIPLGETPVYQTTTDVSAAPVEYIRNEVGWENIEITVAADCGATFCDGHDFVTTLLWGYIVPPATGDYVFYQINHDGHEMYLSQNANFNSANLIVDRNSLMITDTSHWNWTPDTICPNLPVGSDCPPDTVKEYRSDTIFLTAGNVYAFYAPQWNVHFIEDTIYWEGPGISKEMISGNNLMYVYDTIKPNAPSGLTLLTTGVDYMKINWSPGSDDKELAGYNIYVNGYKNNTDIVNDTNYTITGLTPDKKYSIVVTSVDDMGNESDLSNTITSNTYDTDNTPPSPPTDLTVIVQTGMALEVAWEGHSDAETEVVAFNVYIDGTLYNTEDYIWDTTTILKVLDPETDYDITIEAIDAGDNVSLLSSVFPVSTSKFDVNSPDLTVKTGRLKIKMENLSYNYGIGANPNFRDTSLFGIQKTLLEDMHTGTVRWGALTANPLNFNTNIDTETSIGKFMNLCNELDAYTTFTCGVSASTDWRTNSQTFLDFLEYINGPAGTTYGDIREGEGFGPLLDDSRGLIFEFGNEVWGFGAHNASFADYIEYGNWCREMAAVMRTSPYWEEDKIILAYSGRNPHPSDSYGLNSTVIREDTGDVDWLAVSGYLGPINNSDTRLGYYKNTISAVARDMEGLEMTIKDAIMSTGDIKETYFYEGNMTTSAYNGRLGQAIVFTDYCLKAMEKANAIPTIFHLVGGQWRITNPAEGYKRLPLFITAKYFNMFCKGGQILKTKYQTQYEITDDDGNVIDFDPVGGYAYAKDSVNYSVVLLSRDFENTHYVQLDLPDDFNVDGPSGKKYIISGTDYNTFDATIDSSSFTMEDSMFIEVPPYSMVLVKFTGDKQEFEELPLAYFDDYVKATSVTITSEDNSHTIYGHGNELRLSADISPDSAWIPYVNWDIMDNDIGVSFSSGRITTPSSGTGQDTIIIKATSMDGAAYDTFMVYIDLDTEIKEKMDNQGGISIYPNPVNDILTISSNISKKGIIDVINAQGEVIISKILSGTDTKIDVDELEPGIYIVKIRPVGEPAMIRKFIKH